MSEQPQRPRVAAYVVCIADGRILMARYIGPGGPHWTLPGGGIDHAEHPYDAAVREVAEETGHEIQIDRLLGIGSQRRFVDRRGRERDLHTVQIFYTGHITGGELRDEADGSTDQAAWFDLDTIATIDRASLVDVALQLYREQPIDGLVEAARAVLPR